MNGLLGFGMGKRLVLPACIVLSVTLAAVAAGVSALAVEKTGIETRFTTLSTSSAFNLSTDPSGLVLLVK